jgi:hypothetical protein
VDPHDLAAAAGADVDGVEAFARVFAAVASRAPLDLDGMVYRAIAEAAR